MRDKGFSIGLRAVPTILILTLVVANIWGAPLFAASNETVLYSFDGTDGAYPSAGLIFDSAGNFYGTTINGGSSSNCNSGCGTIFELMPGTNGKWKEKVLHSFNSGDGNTPFGGLIFDAAGSLYGTTMMGGAYGFGTVFKLTPHSGGTWAETVLHSFNNDGRDGYWPEAGVIFDASGNLYSATEFGGGYGASCNGFGCGAVFELMPGTNGKWKEKVLHSFSGTDGAYPYAGLIFDSARNLYATTYGGGAHGYGTVFQLTAGAKGKWTEKVLHSFDGPNDPGGNSPIGGVIFDGDGNLYGTTQAGACIEGCGTVFQLTPGAGGKWTEKVLHNFNNERYGLYPQSSLIFDAVGNLYSTTVEGGAGGDFCGEGCGTVFQLTPGEGGRWTEKILHRFKDNGNDGFSPRASLIFDASGKLYSTTGEGGSSGNNGYGWGTVFEITLSPPSPGGPVPMKSFPPSTR
jgi:uncharacterized repeat protein (TIGR03803 family)